MGNLGFYFNQEACVGCRACQVACKDVNNLPVGILYRQVRGFETGAYPSVARYSYSGTCNHCLAPACTEICPTGAMYKDEETGVVLHKDEECIGCKACVEACPYDVPKYLDDAGITGKCYACADLRKNGEQPACVASCPMRALEFGDIDELTAAHAGEDLVSDIACLPSSEQTGPSLAISARKAAFEVNFMEDVCW